MRKIQLGKNSLLLCLLQLNVTNSLKLLWNISNIKKVKLHLRLTGRSNVPTNMSLYLKCRAKKILYDRGVLTGEKWTRGFGAMGRHRIEFLKIFLAADNSFIETLKEAMLFDSKNVKYPHRQNCSNKYANKRKRGIDDDDDTNIFENINSRFQLNMSNEAVSSSMSNSNSLGMLDNEITFPKDVLKYSSQPEINERIRSIKSNKLANAMAHPSYQLLDEESKKAIKQQWLTMLLN